MGRLLRTAVPVLLVAALVPATQAAAAPVRYQAESATISQGVVESNHAGFTGTGFVNGDNVAGSYVQWSVPVPAAGQARVSFRFANGTTANRAADITVNGTLVSDNLSFAGTGAWTTWQDRVITVNLAAGTNTIRATAATAAGLPNLDAVDVDTAPAPVRGVPQQPTELVTGLSLPWATSFLPDGQSALMTERNSFRVSRVTLDGTRTTVGTVPNSVTTNGEGGLMGIAVSPTWNGTTDQAVYLFHTSNDNGQTQNRIVRMNFDGNTLSNRTVVVSGIRSNTFHNGGQLKFGPDGYLYAGTGDAQDTATSQDNNSLNGKILRFTTSGQPAPGNPFGTLVYSKGHRNPQGLAWDSAGRMWSAELGDTQFDELNLIVSGHNYGWPICQGTCSTPGMDNPKRTWTTAEASPSSLAIVNDTAYVAALRGQRLWRVELNGESAGATQAYFTSTFGRLRSVVKVPGANAIWISTSNTTGDKLLRSVIQ
ncbi:PQQ-dependent sugar dehydrogenase [Kribbella sp. CA-253562]|uniref:PQQ-dependent sugar dehydrogenase n=1 Tax=Kribbella sp. CA-253562 TaxID=3239942 RepID=UPI003D92EE6D